MTSLIETIGASVMLALLAWLAHAALRARGGASVLAAIAVAALVLPLPGQAFEMRREEGPVSVPAEETIDDTLIAFGERVEIDGTITGDLVVFAQRVDIRGTVEGQVLAFARSINVDGEISGGLIAFAQSLELGRGNIARNFFGFGQNVTTYADSRVGENAMLFGQNLELAGPVERDVMSFASEIDVRGSIGGDITARGGRLVLEAPARVGGNVLAYVPSEDGVDVSPSAVVGGTVSTEISEADVPDAPFTTLGFYFGQAVRLAAAFIAGALLLWLVPSLRRASLEDAAGALAAAGIGLVALVAAPIIGLMLAVTVIGLPIAAVGVVVWLLALYFAKIVLSHFVGRRLFEATGQQKHFALALLVGLLLMLVAVNLPFVGGLVNLVLTITGLGMLVIWLSRTIQGRPPAGGAPAAA